ncbi:hypothetical protein GCM10007160_13780 [Litchfieldella qijiaojingensis]|uniref:EF-hand domain-containing protein n=1 Tax=Litchfieldella qijiaojingensis TaxID=980347 RepID=A0ABQ2YKR1_9GAMM|nr:EF-hand domain-containing protein [Halomonas qijiaojingensis]GGX87536.1 hypothetical protein GCM10007160_13780 [Halomonas qijiaojingensis]
MKRAMKAALLPVALVFGVSVATAGSGTPEFETLDANQDGALSEEEVQSVEGLDFATMDANGDGTLSEEEFKAATKGEGETGEGGMEDETSSEY